MSAEVKTAAIDESCPPVSGSNSRWIAKKTMFLFLSSEAGELVAAGVVGGNKGLLAVENRRVGRVPKVEVLDVQPPEVCPDGGS